MKAELITCQGCQKDKPPDQYSSRSDRSGRLRPYCKLCSNDIQRARYHNHKIRSPFKHLCTRVKARAKSKGVPFNLTPEYLESIWTGFCPVLGVGLSFETDRRQPDAVQLDRLVPEEGYVIGNVWFMSSKANRMKDAATVDEVEALFNWMVTAHESRVH